MDRDLNKKIEDFRKKVSQTAEEIIFRSFPAKIIELTELIETTQDPESPFRGSNATHSTDTTIYPSTEQLRPNKKRKHENGATIVDAIAADIQFAPNCVPANKHLVEKVYSVIKKEAEELAALVDKVKLWVTLTMPKIEDGDNFGVQIQEGVFKCTIRTLEKLNKFLEVLSELCRSQESAYNLVKYPGVEDYKLALLEHDEKQFYLARQHLSDLRNLYAIIMDLMHKNISKIRTPKANNSAGLY
ncbi:hypothetical protein Ac2012v2_000978 [Leucoagaricus gongylophorus]